MNILIEPAFFLHRNNDSLMILSTMLIYAPSGYVLKE